MGFDRAMRRHHYWRLKQKRRFHWWRDLRQNPSELGSAINTPTPCSCFMCGNPRRYYKQQTLQEQKFIFKYQQDIREYT